MAAFESPTLLHNPKCSKSRAAKALLDDRKIAYRERRYLEEPLSADELARLQELLDRPPRDWVRAGEAAYAEAGLGPNAADREIIAAMARFPILVERPILIMGDRAVVGRPVERIAELLDDAADEAG